MDRILHSVSFGKLFWCPACGECHGVWLNEPNPVSKFTWKWDGNEEKPTFTPSFRVGDNDCHVSVLAGVLHYHGDSKHAFAGKQIPMEPF